MHVITNNIPRQIRSFFEWNDSDQNTILDYFDHTDDTIYGSYFKYKGMFYTLSEFLRFGTPWLARYPDLDQKWCGIFSQDYSMVVSLSDDTETIIIGTIKEG